MDEETLARKRHRTGDANIPTIRVSSGISSMKHLRSPSCMWKYSECVQQVKKVRYRRKEPIKWLIMTTDGEWDAGLTTRSGD